jgi:hypothetical protein
VWPRRASTATVPPAVAGATATVMTGRGSGVPLFICQVHGWTAANRDCSTDGELR